MMIGRDLRLITALWIFFGLQMAVFEVAAATVATTGQLPDGTAYRIDYPDNFNGTVLIGLDYAASQFESPQSQALLTRGYAMAGVTRLVTGWDVERSIANHVATLDLFNKAYGQPRHAVVFGFSLGAHTGAAVIQARADRFDGAVLACGGLAGAVGVWNSKLDALFIAKTLLVPDNSTLPVTNIPADFAATTRPAWLAALAAAQQTAQGRARIALAAVIAQLPTWSHPAKPQPAAYDLAGLQEGLYDSLAGSPLRVAAKALSSRNELERRTGGNLSFNDAIDYGELLKRLKDAAIVRELYREAGLDLEADLAVLRQAPRLTADKKALTWATPQIWKGDLKVPVLTLSNIGDNISPVAAQQAFQSTVDRAGRGDLLRQVYVNSAGHCGFSPAEAMTAVDTLVARLESNEWGGTTNPFTMNAKAQSLNAGAARFIAYQPEAFQRAFDTCDLKVVMRQKSVTVKSKNNDCRK